MSYTPINWQNGKNGGTATSAENFNHMEKGILDAHDGLEVHEKTLSEHESKINDFANQQIPESYLKDAVDNYISQNAAGLATKEETAALDVKIDEVNNQLSSEIANVDLVKLSKLSVFANFAYSGLIDPQRVERTDRITNDLPIEFLSDVVITPNSDYKMIVWEVRANNLKLLPMYTGAMSTDSCNISKNTKVYITIMTSSSATISPSIIDDCVTVLNANTNELLKFNDYFSTSVDNENVLYPSFPYGNITFSNKAWVSAENAFVSRNDIITTNEVIYAESNSVITLNSGYQMLILYTDENGIDIQRFTAWLDNSIEIKKGTYYYIEFRSATVSNSVRADIEASEGVFCANITVSSMVERLNDVEERLDNIVTDNSSNVFTTNDIVEEDFFIKRTDTSGRIINATNPYEKKYDNQYMGQLHCHSWTYGSTTEHTKENVENLYNMYNELGYDFMTITNYPYYDDLTPNPYPNGNMVWLCNSYEQAVVPPVLDDKNQNTHLVCLNAKNVYAPEYAEDKYINEVLEELAVDGVTAVLAHPMWCASETYNQASVSQTLYFKEQLLNLVDKFKFVEIFNSLSKSNNSDSPYIDNTAYALDVLASDGRKVFGFAVSDSHVFSGTADYTMVGGNIKVFAKEKTQLSIWDSIMNGNFYSCDSIYASLKSVDLIDNVLTIDIGANATTKFYGKDGELLDTVEGSVASYTIKGTEMYVRAEVTLTDGKRMWTNPIYLD